MQDEKVVIFGYDAGKCFAGIPGYGIVFRIMARNREESTLCSQDFYRICV
jgi:hypothetical protein